MADVRSVRRLKRANRRKTVYITILVIIIAVLIGIIGVLAALQYKKSKEPSWEYVSMTEEASARAFVWLNKIDYMELSYEDVVSIMGQFNLEIIKTPTKEKGVYTYALADNAYEYCQNQAQVGFERAYKQVIKNRIEKTGYEGEISDETVERLMLETFGMTVSDYLKQCDVKLLPAEDEINEKYLKEVTDEKN